MGSEAGVLSRGGPIYPEAGLSIPRRTYLSRGGPFYPEADLSIPRRAYISRGGSIYPEAGLSIPRRAYLSAVLFRLCREKRLVLKTNPVQVYTSHNGSRHETLLLEYPRVIWRELGSSDSRRRTAHARIRHRFRLTR